MIEDQTAGYDAAYDIGITYPNAYDYVIYLEKEVSSGLWEQIYSETSATGEGSDYESSSSFGKDLFEEGPYRSRLKIGHYLEDYTYFEMLKASDEEQVGNKDSSQEESSPTESPSEHQASGLFQTGQDYAGSDLLGAGDIKAVKDLKNGYARRLENNPHPNTEDELNSTVAIFIDRPRDDLFVMGEDLMEIVGWAIDTHCCDSNGFSGTGIEYVSIYDDKGNAIASARYGLSREDVMLAHGKNYLKSGFRAFIRKADLAAGTNELTVYAYAPSIESWSKTNINIYIK